MTHPVPERSWTMPSPGDTVAGKYLIEAERGRGGLAVVFSAIQSELDRRVAIKMLLPDWAGDAEVVERFVREGRAATRIKSEHVVHVFDVGTLPNGAPYLVLEYLEGHNLDEVVRSWGPLPVQTAVDWLLQAAEAIAEAHAHGIVHRDLKPANLFLTQHADGTACIKVIDFGLSKITTLRLAAPMDALTRTTEVLGSPHYMAPEQLRSMHPVDARTDLWALGVVLYELLTGKLPFAGATLPELFAAVLTQPVPQLTPVRGMVPPAVEQAIYRCLQKEPDARFESITELARALAPYGTRLSRGSFDRIERTVRDNPRLSDWSLLPPLKDSFEDDPWPAAVDNGQAFGTPTSARVVVGSFFMLSGLFIGAFMWIYEDVHAGEHRSVGVTSRQPSAVVMPAPATATPTPAIPTPAPAAPLATFDPAPTAAFPPVPPAAPSPAAPALAPPAKEAAAPFATVAAPTSAPAEMPAVPTRVDERRKDRGPGPSPASRSRAVSHPSRNAAQPSAPSRPWASHSVTDDRPAGEPAAGDPRGFDGPAGESAGQPRVDESPVENDPYVVPDGPSSPAAPAAPTARPPSTVDPPLPAAPDSNPQPPHSGDTLFDGRK